MESSHLLAEKIVDAALYLAEKSSWENIRLFDIASHLNIDLTEIQSNFREKNDLVNAFFERADKAMIMQTNQQGMMRLSSEERLSHLLVAWFQYIQKYRQVAKEIIYSQLEPGHIHTQCLLLLRISRTVQWWREAAQRSATYMHRAVEESGLTTIYLTTLMYWLQDDSKDAVATEHFIQKQLSRANRINCFFKRLFKRCE
ncbi:ubiquinone biosynthesis protein COQ9 [Legionella hackeliae]|uniref:TetR family regulatory protein n=1 Tax=Legionella hackeliae TaxID=449 RepID=A0A0A8UTQ0_LEGHA